MFVCGESRWWSITYCTRCEKRKKVWLAVYGAHTKQSNPRKNPEGRGITSKFYPHPVLIPSFASSFREKFAL